MSSNDITLGIKLTADGKELVGEVKLSRDELEKLGQTTRNTSSEAERLNQSQKSLSSSIRETATELAKYYSIYKVFEQLKEATMLASRIETLNVSLTAVGRNVGYTAEQMQKYVQDVKGMGIATVEAQTTIMRMTQAQMDLGKATQLARVAQDAAVIGNMNSSQALEAMLHGITTLQPEVLRNLGLTVNLENEYARFAATAHRTAASLTMQEKQQIALNAVLREGEKIAGVYEDAMGSVGKQMTSLPRYISDVSERIGNVFTPALSVAVVSFTDTLKDTRQELDSLAQDGSAQEFSEQFAFGMATVIDILRSAKEGVQVIFWGIATLAAGIGAVLVSPFTLLVDTVSGALQTVFDMVQGGMEKLAEWTGNAGFKVIADSMKGVSFATDYTKQVWSDVASVAGKIGESMENSTAGFQTTEKLTEKLLARNEKMAKAAESEKQYLATLSGNVKFYEQIMKSGQMSEEAYAKTVSAMLMASKYGDNHQYAPDEAVVKQGAAKTSAYDTAIKKSNEFIAQLRKEAAEEEKTYGQKKIYEAEVIASAMKVAGAKEKEIVAFLNSSAAIAHENQATKETIANAKAEESANAKRFKSYTDGIDGLEKSILAQRRHNEEIGLTTAQLADLELARMDDAIAIKERAYAMAEASSDDASYIETLKMEIEDLKELRGLKRDGAQKSIASEAIKKTADEAQKMNDEINRGLTDALMRGFESGKDFASNFKDSLVNMFKTLVLRPIISAVLSPVSGAVTGGMSALGFGGQAQAGSSGAIGTANDAYSLYNAANTGIGGFAYQGASMLYGNSAATAAGLAASTYGGGMAFGAAQASALAAQTGAFGAAGAEMTLAAGGIEAGAGASLAGTLASVPVWGWVAAAAALMFMSDSDPTPPSGLLATLKTDPANLPNFRYDRKSGAFSDGAYAESAFGQIGATEAFAYSGESAQKYLDMVASLDNTLATYLSPEAITRVSAELQAKTYGSEGEGWLETALPNMIKDRFTATFAEVNPELTAFLDKFSGTSEEIIAFGGSLLEVDKSLQDTSASTRLFGEVLDWVQIEDAARSGENVVQTFQRLSAEFALTNQIADMMGHDASTAFGSVGLASESARAALIGAAGGLDALAAKTTSFFNKYYSDAERQQASARYSLAVVNDGFAKIGLTVPGTMAEFRNLAEAQDLSTESGRSTYLALMDLADAFATLSAAGGAAAVGLGQAANAIITANQSIGGNYVNNNNLAIGQAANAPIYDQALKEVNARSAALVSGTQVQFGTATDPKLNQEVAGWLAGYRTGGYMTPSAEQTQILRNLSLIPAYASGGLASTGWALVGEGGPELVNFSDPGRVYTADQTRAVFSANDEWDYRQTSGASAIDLSALVDELRQLRQELAEAQYAIARNTRDTAKHMERWDTDGMPEVRAA